MSSVECSVVSYVLNAAWQIPLIAFAGWLGSKAVRRWGPQPQHIVWTATWLLSIFAPILPLFRNIASLSGKGAGAARISITIHPAGAAAATQAEALLLPPWLIWMIFAVYACTLVYFAARLLWLFAGARALARASTPMKWTAESNALWERVRSAFMADAMVLSSSKVRSVMTIGARRPAILLPTGFTEHSTEDELLSALGHEMAHVARRDYAKNLLYEIGSILTAFHPVAWIIKSRIVQTREMACDAMVIARLVDTKTYRQSLLCLAERILTGQPTNIPAVGMFDGNFLKERIMRMKTQQSIPGRLARFGLAGLAALVLLAAAILGTTFAKSVYAQASNPKAPWGTVYKVDKDVTAPQLVYAVDPEYPKSEKASAKTNVICIVGAIVDRSGKPQDVHMVRSAGRDFDTNAVRAVKQYKFKPALRNGEPVAVKINIEVDFRKY